MGRWCFMVISLFIFIAGVTQGKKVKGRGKTNDNPTGSLNVVLEVFSGVPDPKWTIRPGDSNYNEIKTALSSATTYSPDDAPSKLGYQGFRVQEVTQEEDQPEKLVVGPDTESLQLMLLQSGPESKIPPGVRNIVDMEIRNGNVTAVNRNARKRYAPRYNPWDWNGIPHVWENNCYNYASTIRTDTFAQPGRGNGTIYPFPFTANQMKEAAERDGCVPQENKTHMCAPKGDEHLIALMVYIGDPHFVYDRDFHFYRLDNSGYWSHKAGATPATDLDGAGNYILDPRTAVNGYFDYKFVCFMTINRKTATVR